MRKKKILTFHLPNRVDDFTEPMPAIGNPIESIIVDLEDAEPVVEYLIALQRDSAREGLTATGAVLGSIPYLSLQEYLSRFQSASDDYLTFLDMRIFMDPLRDGGEPVPLFAERDAMLIFGLRKRPIDGMTS